MTQGVKVPDRSEISQAYKWNAESVFSSREAWEAEYEGLAKGLGELARYAGRLAEGPAVAAAALAARDGLLERAGKLLTYASLNAAVDTTNQAARALEDQAQGLAGRLLAAAAFIEPELLALGEERLRAWLAPGGDTEFAVYRHYVENLLRRQAHVRTGEVEELLGMLADPFAGPSTTRQALVAADFQFPPARTSDRGQIPVTDGTLRGVLTQPDREARRTGWEGYMDTFLAFRNTLASNLATSLRQDAFQARARRHASVLEAKLFPHNIPAAVVDNLMASFRANLPTWHRYWGVRRRALGVEELQPYDVWAPLRTAQPSVPYEEAVELICAGLAPMGPDYVLAVRRGCLEQRWVDVYPNRGKAGGAFSAGSPGTYPFIVTNYDGTLHSVSTLAHELGHSMHSYLTWQSQPIVYSEYSMFVAEVASNFHQALLRAHLLRTNPDPGFQVAVLEEAMDNLGRYLFIMPTLARFELAVHGQVERGAGLPADSMIEVMADLFAEGYGGQLAFDRARTGITWATFPHLFEAYYVFQYATGIAAAHALAGRILDGIPGAVEAYLAFLRSGSSLYPLDALRLAGVDMTRPEPVDAAFAVLAGYVERLDQLL